VYCVLAFIDRDLHGRRRTENGFGSTRRSRSFFFFVHGHGRELVNDQRFAFESSGGGGGLQKTVGERGGGSCRFWKFKFSLRASKKNDLKILKLEHMFGSKQ